MTTDEKIDQLFDKILMIEKDIQFLKFKIEPLPTAKKELQLKWGSFYKSESGKKVLICGYDSKDNTFLGFYENCTPCWFYHNGKSMPAKYMGNLISEWEG